MSTTETINYCTKTTNSS